MSVAWVLKTDEGELPVGAILAWHRDHVGLGAPELPPGWAPCNGQLLDDPASPYHLTALPELNESKRFLRGGPVSGVLEADAFQVHRHRVTHDLKRVGGSVGVYSYLGGGSANPTRPATLSVGDPIGDGVHGSPRTANETRPANMSVVWILKTRAETELPAGVIVAWHDEPAAGLPPLGAGIASWYPCDGRTVLTPASPYQGQVLPDLNGAGLFLRGGLVSGLVQADAFQGHGHDITHDAFSYAIYLSPGNAWWGGCGDDFDLGSISINEVRDARFDHETRPVNMHVPWIQYLPGGKGPREGLAPEPPRSMGRRR